MERLLIEKNVNVGDRSGCVRITLWNENVYKMKEGLSYNTHGGIVKKFDGEKINMCQCRLSVALKKLKILERYVKVGEQWVPV